MRREQKKLPRKQLADKSQITGFFQRTSLSGWMKILGDQMKVVILSYFTVGNWTAKTSFMSKRILKTIK